MSMLWWLHWHAIMLIHFSWIETMQALSRDNDVNACIGGGSATDRFCHAS